MLVLVPSSHHLVESMQRAFCVERLVPCEPTTGHDRIGVSRSITTEGRPIHGLRHSPHGNMSGWYVYGGTAPMSQDDDYFNPYHVGHLPPLLTPIVRFLGLPRGWRFLWTPDYLDVWYDATLIG